jgi:hypothetical protein
MQLLYNKNQNIEKSRINDNFSGVEKMENFEVFKTFFFNFEIGHKKMSKMDFKKKVCKNENHFFSTFFSDIFFSFFLR